MYSDEVAQCPDCGTTRLVVRRKRDHIDRCQGGFLAWWRRKTGAKLYHCIFCRLQFYSRLPLAAQVAEQVEETNEEDHALGRQS